MTSNLPEKLPAEHWEFIDSMLTPAPVPGVPVQAHYEMRTTRMWLPGVDGNLTHRRMSDRELEYVNQKLLMGHRPLDGAAWRASAYRNAWRSGTRLAMRSAMLALSTVQVLLMVVGVLVGAILLFGEPDNQGKGVVLVVAFTILAGIGVHSFRKDLQYFTNPIKTQPIELSERWQGIVRRANLAFRRLEHQAALLGEEPWWDETSEQDIRAQASRCSAIETGIATTSWSSARVPAEKMLKQSELQMLGMIHDLEKLAENTKPAVTEAESAVEAAKVDQIATILRAPQGDLVPPQSRRAIEDAQMVRGNRTRTNRWVPDNDDAADPGARA